MGESITMSVVVLSNIFPRTHRIMPFSLVYGTHADNSIDMTVKMVRAIGQLEQLKDQMLQKVLDEVEDK